MFDIKPTNKEPSFKQEESPFKAHAGRRSNTPWGDNPPPINQMSFTVSGGLGNSFTDRSAAMAAIAPYLQSTATVSADLVNVACNHLGLHTASFSSRYELPDDFYLSGGRAFQKFIAEENWELVNPGYYAKYQNNLPIATLNINGHRVQNYIVDAGGSAAEVEKIEQLVINAIRPFDEKTVKARQTVYELTDYDMRDNPLWLPQEIFRETVIRDEYYPYINGGVENLMREFLASEENAMIWYGPPGTGKSSALRGMVRSMNILPIIAIKATVFQHRNFLRDIFAYSDETMQEMMLESKVKDAFGNEKDQLKGLLPRSRISDYLKEKWNYDRTEAQKARVPVIVIEDSDLLISKREDHNSLMAQMLNELDGISSNQNRKIIFTTNKMNLSHVDEALLRPGRCFDKIFFRNLTAEEAIAARKAAGLPDFAEPPKESISLAAAMAKPRTKFVAGTDGRFFMS